MLFANKTKILVVDAIKFNFLNITTKQQHESSITMNFMFFMFGFEEINICIFSNLPVFQKS